MRLISIDYAQHEGELNEWKLKGLALGPVNLLVGKNASGKTRALNVIHGLARLLSGDTKLVFLSGDYNTIFEHEGKRLDYVLKYHDAKVVREQFRFAGQTRLERHEGGAGRIFAEKEGKAVEFQTPENELAAVARRDSIQHSFFEPLSEWANSLYHYQFAGEMGGKALALITEKEPSTFNPRDTRQVVAIFRKGAKDFGEPFTESVRKEMAAIGYPLDEIGTRKPSSIIVQGPFPVDPIGLFVKEADLQCITDHNSMSQGMFRALSLIVQTTYSEMACRPSCILIDDIGEGLDFERSCALIEILMNRARRSSVQLVMATNDRFVMNKVPLEAWSVLQRDGGKCRVRNYENSKPVFDEFKFTGMCNFDFFAVDYLSEEQHLNE